MPLNDDIVDMEKLDGICSTVNVNNFSGLLYLLAFF